MTSTQPFNIAIDGPVAAGKGTVSKLLAERLGFLYVDTGAMYRAVALLTLRHQVDPQQEAEVVALLNDVELEVRKPAPEEKDGRLITIILINQSTGEREDISWSIRTEEVSRIVPLVAQQPQVRQILVGWQQQIAAQQQVVMEGRDITYRVLPAANLKIFLTASIEERARRRWEQILAKGEDVELEKVKEDLIKRDELDSNRATDPLKKVPDAWEVDTTNLDIDEVVALIEERVVELSQAS